MKLIVFRGRLDKMLLDNRPSNCRRGGQSSALLSELGFAGSERYGCLMCLVATACHHRIQNGGTLGDGSRGQPITPVNSFSRLPYAHHPRHSFRTGPVVAWLQESEMPTLSEMSLPVVIQRSLRHVALGCLRTAIQLTLSI